MRKKILAKTWILYFLILWVPPQFIFQQWFFDHQGFQALYLTAGILGIGIFQVIISLRSITKFSSSGMQISEKIWDLVPNQPIKLIDLWPDLEGMASLLQSQDGKAGDQIFIPTQSTITQIDSIPVETITLGEGAPLDLTQVRLTFAADFPGKLQLFSQTGFVIGHDQQLESLEFNKHVVVYGTSMETAYKILSPNFMTWYMDLQTKPAILFEKNHAFLTFESGLQEQALRELITGCIYQVQHSGALEKKP